MNWHRKSLMMQLIGMNFKLKGLGKRFKKTVMNQMQKIKRNPSWFLKESDYTLRAHKL